MRNNKMNDCANKHPAFRCLWAAGGKIALIGAVSALSCVVNASPGWSAERQALTFINSPLPPEVQSKVYAKPSRAPETTAAQITAGSRDTGTQTAVGHKVDDMRSQLFALQGHLAEMADRLANQESADQRQAADYYAAVATIDTQLQSGTTPGNPRMTQKLTEAHADLETLSGNAAALSGMAQDAAGAASAATVLLQSVRASFSLSGAVEEDHVRLAQLEDAITSTSVFIDRLLNNVNDDINRTTAYVTVERENLRTLGLAVEKGDLFGKSLSNRPFSSASLVNFMPETNPSAAPSSLSAPASPAAGIPAGMRPLVKIRFDRPDVSYEQPVYSAVNEALQRYPDARFELVAVHPSNGNPAETAIESAQARRDAEKVLRSLTQMGLSLDRIDLSYMPSADAATDEVHLYVR
jgi:hypothetical protein